MIINLNINKNLKHKSNVFLCCLLLAHIVCYRFERVLWNVSPLIFFTIKYKSQIEFNWMKLMRADLKWAKVTENWLFWQCWNSSMDICLPRFPSVVYRCFYMYTYVWVVSGCVWVWSHNRLVATIVYGCQTRSFMLVSFKCYARFWPSMPTIVKYSTHTHICILCVYLVTHNTCTLGYIEKVPLSNMS